MYESFVCTRVCEPRVPGVAKARGEHCLLEVELHTVELLHIMWVLRIEPGSSVLNH